jgi:hypothetical protein
MGVRFRSNFYSTLNDIQYKVEIWDSTYSGSIVPMTTEGEGFEITYQQQGDERFAAVKGSECSIYATITDGANGTLLQNWINGSMNATQEDLYHIAIYKGSSLYWFGVILPDLNTRMDQSRPYSYKITATDGLARMKDKEFAQAVDSFYNPAIGRKTFVETIFELLKYSPLYTATSQDNMFSTCVGWYEANMPAKADTVDPLGYSAVRWNTWTKTDENKVLVGLSYYDVLVSVCESWGMRVMFSNGLYRFTQVNSYEDDGIIKYQRYYTRGTGVFNGVETFIGQPVEITNDTFPYVAAGNQWSWYAPVKYVYLRYPFKNNNMLDGLTTMTQSGTSTYKYIASLRRNIIGYTTSRLQLDLGLSIYLNPASGSSYFQITIQVKFKLGGAIGTTDIYLEKDILRALGTETWSTTSTDVWQHLYTTRGLGWVDSPTITLSTPSVPLGIYDTNNLEVEIIEIIDTRSGITLTPGTDYVAYRKKGQSNLRYITSSNNANEQYFEYIGRNSGTAINSYDLKLNDSLIGEPYDPSEPGQIFTSNGTDLFQSLGEWKYEDTGANLSFNLMRVREVLAGQTIPIRKYQGQIISGNLEAYNSIEYDGFRYILNGATFKAQSDTWEGEWYQVSVDRLSFEDIGGAEPQTGDGGTNGLIRGIGNAWGDGNTALKQLQSLSNERILTTVSAQIDSGTQDTIYIDATGVDLIKQGDYLRILTQNGTNADRVIVAADVTGGDTTITIQPYDFGLVIPIGSVLAWDMERTVLNYLRLGADFPTSDPAIVGVVYNNGGTLKVSAG